MCGGWLGQSSATLAAWLTALFTLGAALVAYCYVIVTQKLARSAADQALAAKAQADVTQKMFEATYRPYLEIVVGSDGTFTSSETCYVGFDIKCHGQVPATITSWNAVFAFSGEPETPVVVRSSGPSYRYGLFPGGQHPNSTGRACSRCAAQSPGRGRSSHHGVLHR